MNGENIPRPAGGSNKSFFMGLLAGVAILALVGFFVMLGLYLKTTNTQADLEPITVAGNNPQPSQVAAPAKKVAVNVGADDHIRGSINAPVTIIEFSDFQCPYCGSFHETMQQVMASYPKDVRWVYRHFPLDGLHPYARQAAEASECAGDQDKFWEYTDGMFSNQSNINPAELTIPV